MAFWQSPEINTYIANGPGLAFRIAACLQRLESKLSRGPGYVERAIKAAFDAEPRRVFTTESLLTCVYGRASIEKKHRVSVIRAAKHLLQSESDWHMIRLRQPGAPFVFFNRKYIDESEIAGPYHFAGIDKR